MVNYVAIFLCFVFVAPLFLETIGAYRKKDTSTIMENPKYFSPFKLGIVTEWIDLKKLEGYLPEMQTWTSDIGSMNLHSPFHLFFYPPNTPLPSPTVCQFLHALLVRNVGEFPAKQAEATRKLLRKWAWTLDQLEIIKNKGLVNFMLSIAKDPKDIIVNITDITDQTATTLDIVPVPFYAAGRIHYEIDLNSTILNSGGWNNKKIIRLSFYPYDPVEQLICSTIGAVAAMWIYRDRPDLYSADGVPSIAPKKGFDRTVHVTVQELKLVNKPGRPCQPPDTYDPGCFHRCLMTYIKCPCEALSLDPDMPVIRNVSNLCHKYQPFEERCEVDIKQSPENVITCREKCAIPCVQMNARMRTMPSTQKETKTFNGEDANVPPFHMDIHIHRVTPNMNIEEFEAHNLGSLVCTAGAILSLIYGYSFITVFSWMSDAASFFGLKLGKNRGTVS